MLIATFHRDGKVSVKDPDNKMVDPQAKIGTWNMTGSKNSPYFRFKDNYGQTSPMYATQQELKGWISKNVTPIMKK